jgi:hypothetical protein
MLAEAVGVMSSTVLSRQSAGTDCCVCCCAPAAGYPQALALRRPALLSAVMLRQNPHNVAEWHKRVNLFKGDPTKQVRPGHKPTWGCQLAPNSSLQGSAAQLQLLPRPSPYVCTGRLLLSDRRLAGLSLSKMLLTPPCHDVLWCAVSCCVIRS